MPRPMLPLPADAVTEIRELAPLARRARRQHLPSDPKVVASKEFTQTLKRLYAEGYTISQLAKAAGMTYHSISARVKRKDDE